MVRLAVFPVAALVAAFSLPVFAEAISGKEAKKALFAPSKAMVEILAEAGLPDDQAKTLELVGGAQAYYGAIAIAPDEGLMSEATVAAANYHDTDAASKAAQAECNAKKKGGAACIVVALIRPKAWTSGAVVQLSSEATAAFKESYSVSGPSAFAVSSKTGVFGLAKGEGALDAALADCAAKSDKAKDCSVVIAD